MSAAESLYADGRNYIIAPPDNPEEATIHAFPTVMERLQNPDTVRRFMAGLGGASLQCVSTTPVTEYLRQQGL